MNKTKFLRGAARTMDTFFNLSHPLRPSTLLLFVTPILLILIPTCTCSYLTQFITNPGVSQGRFPTDIAEKTGVEKSECAFRCSSQGQPECTGFSHKGNGRICLLFSSSDVTTGSWVADPEYQFYHTYNESMCPSECSSCHLNGIGGIVCTTCRHGYVFENAQCQRVNYSVTVNCDDSCDLFVNGDLRQTGLDWSIIHTEPVLSDAKVVAIRAYNQPEPNWHGMLVDFSYASWDYWRNPAMEWKCAPQTSDTDTSWTEAGYDDAAWNKPRMFNRNGNQWPAVEPDAEQFWCDPFAEFIWCRIKLNP